MKYSGHEKEDVPTAKLLLVPTVQSRSLLPEAAMNYLTNLTYTYNPSTTLGEQTSFTQHQQQIQGGPNKVHNNLLTNNTKKHQHIELLTLDNTNT